MKRFSNILYFADGIEGQHAALTRAIALAHHNGARLTVMDVVAQDQAFDGGAAPVDLDIPALLREDREASLDCLIADHESPGAPIARRVVSGVPFAEVIRAVTNHGHDLVIKDARPPDSFVKRTLGSTDLHLLRKCPCPIWIERPDAVQPYRTILAAVDPVDLSPEDPARLIMDLATSLAEREGARLAVVHAWHLQGEEEMRSGRVKVAEETIDMLLEAKQAAHLVRLTALLGDYGMASDDPSVHLVKRPAAAGIRDMSRELNADLVVMGTLGRPGSPGIFVGNTAEDVLQTTLASVFALKPYGFVSPVTD